MRKDIVWVTFSKHSLLCHQKHQFSKIICVLSINMIYNLRVNMLKEKYCLKKFKKQLRQNCKSFYLCKILLHKFSSSESWSCIKPENKSAIMEFIQWQTKNKHRRQNIARELQTCNQFYCCTIDIPKVHESTKVTNVSYNCPLNLYVRHHDMENFHNRVLWSMGLFTWTAIHTSPNLCI